MLNVLRINWYLHRAFEVIGLFFALVSAVYIYLFAVVHRPDLVVATVSNLFAIAWWSNRMSQHAVKAKVAFTDKFHEYERLYG